MGRIEEVDKRIDVELRLESFVIVGPDGDHHEFDYRDATAIGEALTIVLMSDRYADDQTRRARAEASR